MATITFYDNTFIVDKQSDRILLATYVTSSAPSTISVQIVNWGDGIQPSGTYLEIMQIGESSGPQYIYGIYGSHTYTLINTYFITISINVGFGPQSYNGGTYTVTDAKLRANAQTITGIEGDSINNTIVGVIQYNDSTASTSIFNASINWGDGSSSSGSLSKLGNNNTELIIEITGSHTYSICGTYTITISVSNPYTTLIFTSTAFIADATLTASGSQPSLSSAIINGPIASFTDSNPYATINDYQTLVSWGDHSSLDMGTITQPGGVGTTFIVNGSHIYNSSGTFTPQISVIHGDIRLIIYNSITVITPAPITDTGVGPLLISPALVFGHPNRKIKHALIATFIDQSNTNLDSSYFTTTINWGDNHVSCGHVTQNLVGTSQYTIKASHKYLHKGKYLIKITIHDSAGPLCIHATTMARINL